MPPRRQPITLLARGLFLPKPPSPSAQPQPIGRAADTPSTSVQDVGIDHGGAHILMAKQFLDRPNVIAILKQGSRERQKARRPPGPYSAREGIGIVDAPSIVSVVDPAAMITAIFIVQWL